MAAHVLPRGSLLLARPTSRRRGSQVTGTAPPAVGRGLRTGCRPHGLPMPRRGRVSALALQTDGLLLSERTSPEEVAFFSLKDLSLLLIGKIWKSRFFSARKHGLVDAAVRNNPSDMTAVVALPGGIGTLDEVFEILALIQLERIGSKFPVPFLLMNYDSFYSKLLDFLDDSGKWGTVARGEVEALWKVCGGNSEASDYLAEFYGLPHTKINNNRIRLEGSGYIE
ncbi:hypothetical protein GW17_00009603 [Ensete ventricosum]|nr:hypothetical protein GW17_00009603 [Ensete ventricosum]